MSNADKEQLHEDVPFQSVDESSNENATATCSATCSKSSPPFLASAVCSPRSWCATRTPLVHTERRLTASNRGATHIVKLWEPNECPQLAANEFFCLTVARKCGLDVPLSWIAEDGMALVIDRFDLPWTGYR